MSINPQKARFYATILLNRITKNKTGFDAEFSQLVRKYNVSPRESAVLYRLLYKLLTYYHSVKFLASYHGFSPRVNGVIEYLYTRGFDFDLILDEVKEAASTLSPTLRISILYGYPSWFIRELYGKTSPESLELALKSLNEKKRWLRVNSLKTSKEEALECLEKTGVKVKPHPEFNELLLVSDPFIKVGGNECVKKGLVIPQDISSYISTMLINVDQGDLVDACSAPGVKLLQIYSLNKPSRIISVDISEKRLRTLLKIIEYYVGKPYSVIVINADSAKNHYNTNNATIVIDAPCSNSGAIYSDPAIKLHLSKRSLRKLSLTQRNILENSLTQGKLIYFMTCSIHPSEGEEVIDHILEKHENKVTLETSIQLPGVSKGYSGYKSTSRVYRIQPHEVNGQGFFIAILRVK